MSTKRTSSKTTSKKVKSKPATGKKQLNKSGDPIIIGGGGG
jgi:hypothetical protein